MGITLILRFFRIATIGLNFTWNQESQWVFERIVFKCFSIKGKKINRAKETFCFSHLLLWTIIIKN